TGVGERRRRVRDRARAHTHGVGGLARIRRRRARRLPAFQRDGLARIPLGDARLHRRGRHRRRRASPSEHPAHRARQRATGARLTQVAVLQAGSWGTTLATILARDGGRDVLLWTRDQERARALAAERENRRYLPGIRIPDRVTTTADLERAVSVADDLIVAAPSIGVLPLRDALAPLLRPGHHILSATKGLAEQGRRMSELW